MKPSSAELSNQAAREFFQAYPVRRYRRGEVVVFADETAAPITYLESGIVGQYDVMNDGTRVMLHIFQPGAFFPMSSALNNMPNRYFFEAITDVEARQSPAPEAARWLTSDPEAVLDLLKRVYRGTDDILGRMSLLMAGTARSRLAYELRLMAERFGEIQPDGQLAIRVTEHQLAQQTGLARETISRELTALRRTGVIDRRRGGLTMRLERLG